MIEVAFHFCPRCGGKLEALGHNQTCRACGKSLYKNQNVCVSAVVIQDGKMLFVRRGEEPCKGMLDLSGGYVEPNEHPEKGMKREILEELGVDSKVTRLLGVYGPDLYPYEGVNQYNLGVTYLVELLGKDLKPMDDVASLEWYSLKRLPELDELAFESQRQLLQELKAGKISL